MSLTDPTVWTALGIVAAVLLGIVRLILWQGTAPNEARGSRIRMASLIGLQILAGALLWLTLNPPASVLRTGTLFVATAGSPATVATGAGDILIALPEAGPVTGAERVPDLATALRRHPMPARIHILGQGLVPRDQSPLPVEVEFEVSALPPGLIDVSMPGAIAAGTTFLVGGQVGTLAGGRVELVDPADQVVSTSAVRAGERFALTSAARTSGLALFDLRLRNASGELIERIAVPVETLTPAAPRVAVLAGAPGPETKFLQRWAEDAGVDLAMDITVGAGVSLGGTPIALNAATLGGLDLLVMDDRRWSSLSAGQKAALTTAVERGLGLLLRPTGPLSDATRRDWAGLGLSVAGGDDAVALRVDAADQPSASVDDTDRAAETPELARRNLAVESASAVTLLRDAEGNALASWRARGRGRVGIWTVTDSYALILTGRSDRYGEMWSALFSELGRPGEDSRALIQGLARAGERVTLCRLNSEATVLAQDGRSHGLRIDPATGERACAAYWPEQSGWHVVRDGEDRQTPFYVHPTGDAPSLAQAANRSATLGLVGRRPDARVAASTSRAPGSPWPWFAALLVALSALWWLERNRTIGGLAKALQARLVRR